MESYVQETSKEGRDGHQSVAYVFYHGVMLNHIDTHMKSFIVDNMSLSHLESSALEEENANDSCDDDVLPPMKLVIARRCDSCQCIGNC